jgi:hypothetical protein
MKEWPTLEEIKERFKNNNDSHINEEYFKKNVYILFSDIYNIDEGISLFNYFDLETIVAVVDKSYIPTADDINYISKKNKCEKNSLITFLFSNINRIYKDNLPMNKAKDLIIQSKAPENLENIYEKTHPFSMPDVNQNYEKFLTRLEILESFGTNNRSIYDSNEIFSKEDPLEIRKWVLEQINKYNIGRLENEKSIKRLNEIQGWTWDLIEFNLKSIENNIKNKSIYPNISKLNYINKNKEYIYNNTQIFPCILKILVDVEQKVIASQAAINIINDVLTCKINPKKIELDIIDSFVFKTNVKTLKTIGKSHKLSREAVRQVKNKLYSKLYHPSTLYYIKNIHGNQYLEEYINKFIK